MGFETYRRILDEAIREIKQDEFKDMFTSETKPLAVEAIVETEMSALLPESYVSREDDRMQLYRRLYSVDTNEQIEEIAEELRDRFGKMPPEAENLCGVVRVRLALSKIGFAKARLGLRKVEFEFPPESDKSFYESPLFQSIMERIGGMKNLGVTLKHQGNKLTVSAPQPQGTEVAAHALSFLRELAAD